MSAPLFYVKEGAKYILSMEMATLVGWLSRRWQEAGLGQFVITSGQDGAHRGGSLHYSGNAVDIRTRHLFDQGQGRHRDELIQFALMIQSVLGKRGVRVVVHPDWVSGPAHLHVGYQPKGTAQEQQLWEWTK